MVTAARRSSSFPRNEGARPAGLVLNRLDLVSVRKHTNANPDVEYLYLRENDFSSFDPWQPLQSLKVLDISLNYLQQCDFLWAGGEGDEVEPLTPNLRHLYLTGNAISSLQHFVALRYLETLALSSNAIGSFEGLGSLPNLRVLSLHHNDIRNFKHFPHLPRLNAINLHGNPIASAGHYRVLTTAVCGTELRYIDGEPVQGAERDAAKGMKGRLVYCLTEGFWPLDSDWDDGCERAIARFLATSQAAPHSALRLVSIALLPTSPPQEGCPMHLAPCIQDTRPPAIAASRVFHCDHLIGVAFKITGKASDVQLWGSFNSWDSGVRMERESGDTFVATLYLPAGDVEYRYVVDGVQAFDNPTTTSKYSKGRCSLLKVPIPAPRLDDERDERDSLLHIRWLRSTGTHGFELIAGAEGVEYKVQHEDVGGCLRAEVLCYEEGDFKALFFDISKPVRPHSPTVEIALKGRPVEEEYIELKVQYVGGTPGVPEIRWLRVLPGGDTEDVVPLDPYLYKLTRLDLACEIMVEFTPVRSDGLKGTPAYAKTDVIQEGAPTILSPRFLTQPIEGQDLILQYGYSGGLEGASRIVWRRYSEEEEGYHVVQTGGKAFTPSLSDVGHAILVEITPVSASEREGAPELVMSPVVQPGRPEVRSLSVAGVPGEGDVLEAKVAYCGGLPGDHEISWWRCPQGSPPQTGNLVSTHTTHQCTKEDVGYVLSVTVVPHRSDGARGDPVTYTTAIVQAADPVLTGLHLKGEEVEGAVLEVGGEYSGGREGKSVIQWKRILADGSEVEVPVDGRKHLLGKADVGSLIKVVYVPVRHDGVKGSPCYVVSGVIAAAPPQVTKLAIRGPLAPEPGDTLQAEYEYIGGEEGTHDYEWCGQPGGPSYVVRDDDLGEAVGLRMRGVREDGLRGEWVVAPSTRRVGSGRRQPVVTLPREVPEGNTVTPQIDMTPGMRCSSFWQVDCEVISYEQELRVHEGDVGAVISFVLQAPPFPRIVTGIHVVPRIEEIGVTCKGVSKWSVPRQSEALRVGDGELQAVWKGDHNAAVRWEQREASGGEWVLCGEEVACSPEAPFVRLSVIPEQTKVVYWVLLERPSHGTKTRKTSSSKKRPPEKKRQGEGEGGEKRKATPSGKVVRRGAEGRGGKREGERRETGSNTSRGASSSRLSTVVKDSDPLNQTSSSVGSCSGPMLVDFCSGVEATVMRTVEAVTDTTDVSFTWERSSDGSAWCSIVKQSPHEDECGRSSSYYCTADDIGFQLRVVGVARGCGPVPSRALSVGLEKEVAATMLQHISSEVALKVEAKGEALLHLTGGMVKVKRPGKEETECAAPCENLSCRLDPVVSTRFHLEGLPTGDMTISTEKREDRDMVVLMIRLWSGLSNHAICSKFLGEEMADAWQAGLQDKYIDPVVRTEVVRKAMCAPYSRPPPVGAPEVEEVIHALRLSYSQSVK